MHEFFFFPQRIFIEVFSVYPPCGTTDMDAYPSDWWYYVVYKLHYLHFGMILWFVSGVIAVIVSLVTDPIPDDHLYR